MFTGCLNHGLIRRFLGSAPYRSPVLLTLGSLRSVIRGAGTPNRVDFGSICTSNGRQYSILHPICNLLD